MDDMQTMLASAIEDFDVELARMLIVENDVVPKNVDEEAMFLFIQNAVISNDKPLLKQLLKYDRRLNGRVLWKVLDNVEIATFFVCSGVDLNVTRDDSLKSTFLHILLASHDPTKITLAELMIDNNADLSVFDDKGRSVLQHAIEVGAPIDFIRKIIWNSVGDFEKNVVAIADSDRYAELSPTLLSFITANSVNETTKMQRVKDALSLLTDEDRACRKDAIIALLQLVIPPDILDSEDEPVLDIRRLLGSHLAGKILWYMFDDIKIANLLVRSDLNVRGNSLTGSSFLHVLSGSKDLNKLKLAELMIEYGADVNVVNLAKNTVLQCAIYGEAPKEFIRMLIQKSIDNFGYNAVTIIESYRHTELLPELISVLADTSVDEPTRNKRVVNVLMSLSSPSPLMVEKTRKVTIERLLKIVIPAHMFDVEVNESELNNTILENTYLGGKILWYMLDDMKMATMLIRSGANLNVRRDDVFKETFLHVLSVTNDPSKIKLAEMMIDRNADISAVDLKERSVLQCAMKAGARQDFISKLIMKSTYNFEKNAIIIADSKQIEELLPVLVHSIMDSSIDEATRSSQVKDAIYSLIDHPAVQIPKARRTAIAYLLKHAMPVDMFDYKAYTYLHEAILTRNYKFVELLLQHGADPNSEKFKELPLLWYAATMEESSMAILLIKYGADIHHQSRNGVRPIHGACKSSSTNNLLLLIRLGADVNVVDNSGQTPLIVFSEKDSLEDSDLYHIIIRRLALEALKGAKISSRDMGLIRDSTILQMLFDSCMDELYRMQKMEIVEGIPYSNFLIESVERMSKYVRRNDLSNISRYDSFFVKLEKLFPFYSNDFQDAYNFAKARQRLLIERKQLLSGIVSELYQITLPDVVISKIVNYLCFDEELKSYILKFHSATFQ